MQVAAWNLNWILRSMRRHPSSWASLQICFARISHEFHFHDGHPATMEKLFIICLNTWCGEHALRSLSAALPSPQSTAVELAADEFHKIKIKIKKKKQKWACLHWLRHVKNKLSLPPQFSLKNGDVKHPCLRMPDSCIKKSTYFSYWCIANGYCTETWKGRQKKVHSNGAYHQGWP